MGITNRVLIFLSLVNAACGSDAPSHFSDFAPVKRTGATTQATTRLSFADKIGFVDYQIRHVEHFWGRDLEMAHVEVLLSPMSEQTFFTLRHHYGFGQSKIRFRTNQTYRLKDFLTPMMQALEGLEFHSEMQPDYSYLAANCWSTVYEFLRVSQQNLASIQIYFTDREPMQTALENPAHFEPVVTADTLRELDANEDVNFGDVLLMYDHNDHITHAAIIVDQGLYFEKVALVDHSPYRLVDSHSFYYQETEGTYFKVYRLKQGNLALPEPRSIFSSKAIEFFRDENGYTNARHVERDLVFREVILDTDANGRSSIAH